jgi:hypothetical protein
MKSRITAVSHLSRVCAPPLLNTTMPRRGRGAAVAARPPTTLLPPDSDSEELDLTRPAVIESPVKARAVKKGIKAKPDLAVWDLSDKAIIG